MSIFDDNIQNSRYFAKYNLFLQTSKKEDVMTNPKDIAYLLDSKRHKKDKRFRKSSVAYWGPLLIAACLLYYYF
jgi:hypothetical protein